MASKSVVCTQLTNLRQFLHANCKKSFQTLWKSPIQIMHLQKSACESPSKMALNNTFFGLFEKKQPEKTLNSSKILKKTQAKFPKNSKPPKFFHLSVKTEDKSSKTKDLWFNFCVFKCSKKLMNFFVEKIQNSSKNPKKLNL